MHKILAGHKSELHLLGDDAQEISYEVFMCLGSAHYSVLYPLEPLSEQAADNKHMNITVITDTQKRRTIIWYIYMCSIPTLGNRYILVKCYLIIYWYFTTVIQLDLQYYRICKCLWLIIKFCIFSIVFHKK